MAYWSRGEEEEGRRGGEPEEGEGQDEGGGGWQAP